MATTAIPKTKISGGSFLLEERQTAMSSPQRFFEQQLMIGQTTEEFATKEILPRPRRLSTRISRSRAIW